MSEPLWRWRELCEALGLPGVDGPDVHGISIDSRSLEPGDLFIALTGDPGPRFTVTQRSDRDGHDFVDAALGAGAAGVLTHDAERRAVPELKVTDTLDALWALAAAARTRLDCPVVAITGSSGKTTTKEFMASALGAFRTAGSLNNHLGVPLSLVRTPRDAQSAVYEIGMNHPGEIAPLSELARPDVAVVLNVHPAHAEFFDTMEDLRSEKLSISAGLRNDGVFVVEDLIDDSEIDSALERVRFGATNRAAVRLIRCEGVDAEYEVDGRVFEAHVPGGGRHRAMSLGAVLAVHVALGRDPNAACSLSDDLVPRGRGTELVAGGVTLIDDSYNANPESMRAALNALAERSGRRLALLGEMLELGENSAAYHRALRDACEDLDGVILVGEGMAPLADVLGPSVLLAYRPDTQGLAAWLQGQVLAGDTLLVKGSNRVFWAHDFVTELTDALTEVS